MGLPVREAMIFVVERISPARLAPKLLFVCRVRPETLVGRSIASCSRVRSQGCGSVVRFDSVRTSTSLTSGRHSWCLSTAKFVARDHAGGGHATRYRASRLSVSCVTEACSLAAL